MQHEMLRRVGEVTDEFLDVLLSAAPPMVGDVKNNALRIQMRFDDRAGRWQNILHQTPTEKLALTASDSAVIAKDSARPACSEAHLVVVHAIRQPPACRVDRSHRGGSPPPARRRYDR